jgi:hypothetical protein
MQIVSYEAYFDNLEIPFHTRSPERKFNILI